MKSWYSCVLYENGNVYAKECLGKLIPISDVPPEKRYFSFDTIKLRDDPVDFELSGEQQQKVLDAFKQVPDIKGLNFVNLFTPKLFELFEVPSLKVIKVTNSSNWIKHWHLLPDTVEELSFQSGSLNDFNVEVLCNALCKFKDLKRLVLHHIEMSLGYLQKILTALESCPKLETFLVDDHQDMYWRPIKRYDPPVSELIKLEERGCYVKITIGKVVFPL